MGLARAHDGQLPLLGLAEVQADTVDRREEEDQLGAQILGQALAGAVLVDDGVDAAQAVLRADDGDPAAACRDDREALREQAGDRLLLHDLQRRGRGDHAAVASPRVLLEDPALFPRDGLRLLAAVKTADRLAGVLKGRVLRVHDHLRHDAEHLPRQAAAAQLIVQRLLQMIADIALGHGGALREGKGRKARLFTGGEIHRRVDHADLRAVAVADDQLMPLRDHVRDHDGGAAHRRDLIGRALTQSVAAQGHCDPSLRHLSRAWRRSRP